LGYLTIWPTGQVQPNVSTLNAPGGTIVANAAIVPAGSNGSVSVYDSDQTDFPLDIDGYFAPQNALGLPFYSAAPCRVADTRNPAGTFGARTAGNAVRNLPIPARPCGIPATAEAYSLNLTVVPPGPLSYLSAWAAGQSQPAVSTLNALDGRIVANGALVPAGGNGAVSLYSSDPTNVLVDHNGYFAPQGGAAALSFYPLSALRPGRNP